MSRSTKVAFAASLAMAINLSQAHAASDVVTITTWGGSYTTAMQKAFFEPFGKNSDIKIREDQWDGSTARIQAMVDTQQVTWDLVSSTTNVALQGCEEGWLEKIDYSKLGGKEKFMPGAAMECGVAIDNYGIVFAYNKDKYPGGGPTTMADFFDVNKYPGPRALYKGPKYTMEFALIGDGVKPSEVYKVLATEEGVNRAFKKLDSIKPSIKVWWTAGAQPPQLLADGEVSMAISYDGRIQAAIKEYGKNLQIVRDGQALDFDIWVIPKGAKNLAAAEKFLQFTTAPKVAAGLSDYIAYGPAIPSAMPFVKPGIVNDLPNAPENMTNSFTLSAEFWADHEQELTERFNKWLAK